MSACSTTSHITSHQANFNILTRHNFLLTQHTTHTDMKLPIIITFHTTADIFSHTRHTILNFKMLFGWNSWKPVAHFQELNHTVQLALQVSHSSQKISCKPGRGWEKRVWGISVVYLSRQVERTCVNEVEGCVKKMRFLRSKTATQN